MSPVAGWCRGRIWACGLEMVSADQILLAAAAYLGVEARLVTAPAPL